QQSTMNLFADMGVQPTTRQEGLVAAAASTDRTPPASRVDGGAARAAATRAFQVTGVASDSGGVVAGVEVSVDGGRTWHPADGTTRWRYRFEAAAAPGAGTIL